MGSSNRERTKEKNKVNLEKIVGARYNHSATEKKTMHDKGEKYMSKRKIMQHFSVSVNMNEAWKQSELANDRPPDRPNG